MNDKERIEELEDAITDVGIILAGSDTETDRLAMRRLQGVMKDPKILKRQGI